MILLLFLILNIINQLINMYIHDDDLYLLTLRETYELLYNINNGLVKIQSFRIKSLNHINNVLNINKFKYKYYITSSNNIIYFINKVNICDIKKLDNSIDLIIIN